MGRTMWHGLDWYELKSAPPPAKLLGAKHTES